MTSRNLFINMKFHTNVSDFGIVILVRYFLTTLSRIFRPTVTQDKGHEILLHKCFCLKLFSIEGTLNMSSTKHTNILYTVS